MTQIIYAKNQSNAPKVEYPYQIQQRLSGYSVSNSKPLDKQLSNEQLENLRAALKGERDK